ncbi:response regulator [Methanochimaera problematica]|nr:PAS domain S-box protein [Methanoplanus sp. FWC-SCC4]
MKGENPEESTISVLYVDDEPMLLDIGKIYIEKSGNFNVTKAQNANAGIDLLKDKSFDCIISDYQMPGMDGIEFLKQIRNKGNNTPFIIFTGKGREEIVIEAINNGADFYVQKGGEPKSQFTELLHKIRHAVSARKSGEELIKSEKKYKYLVENSPNFIFSYDLDNRFKSANSALCEFLGLSEEEIIGKNYEELDFPEKTYNYLYKLHERVYETADVVKAENTIKMPGGEIHYYNIILIPVFDQKGFVTGIMGNSTDITDKVNSEKDLIEKNHKLLLLNEDLSAAEEEIRQQFEEIAKSQHFLIETNQYMDALFNNSASLVLVWDNNFRVTKVNKAVEEMTGISGKISKGLPLDDIITPDKKDELTEKLMHLSSKDHIRGFETKIKNLSGEIRTVQWDIARIYDYAGKQISTTAQGQDITKNIEYHNRLLEKNKKLLLANEEIAAAEEELRQQMDEIAISQRIISKSERRISDFLNLLPDPTFAIDRSGDIIVWNAAMAETYGHSAEEMIGKGNHEYSKLMYGHYRPTLVDMLLNYDENLITENYKSCSFKNGKLEGYVSYKNVNGQIVTLWGIATLLYNEDGEVEGAIETFRDVTDIEKNRKELEKTNEELSAAEEEIRQQFDEIATAQHTLIETNQYLEKLFNNSASLVLVLDNDLRITKANEAFEKLTGILEKDLINICLYDLISGDKKEEILLKINETKKMKKITGFEIAIRSASGEERRILWDIAQIFDYSGKHIATTWQGHDITDILEYQNRILEINEKLNIANEKLAAAEGELRQAHHQLKLITGITRHDILNSIMAAEGYLDLINCSDDSERDDYLNKLNDVIQKIQMQIEFTREYETPGSHAPAWQDLTDILYDLDSKAGVPIQTSACKVEIFADHMLKKVFESLLDNTLRHGGDNLSGIEVNCMQADKGELRIIWEDNGPGIIDADKEKIFEQGYGKNTGLGLFLVREALKISGIKIHEAGIYGKGARFIMTVPQGRYHIIQ